MDPNVKITIIAAVSRNGVIGKDNKIPWTIPSDIKRFAGTTKGHTVLMGRRTYESIGKPLPGRMNIVLTGNHDYFPEGCVVVHSFADAIMAHDKSKTLFVIGGSKVYEEAFKYATDLCLTEVDAEVEGDTFFPEWNRNQWEEFHSELDCQEERDQYPYSYRIFSRKEFCVLGNARTEDQRETMERINAGGYCPFCMENLEKNHKKPIVYDGTHWIVTENQWPYPAAKFHFLIIAKEHTEKLADLPRGAGDELLFISSFIEAKYGIESGALCMRFGEPYLNGGTVDHLHAHLIVPDSENEKPLFFWVDTKKKK